MSNDLGTKVNYPDDFNWEVELKQMHRKADALYDILHQYAVMHEIVTIPWEVFNAKQPLAKMDECEVLYKKIQTCMQNIRSNIRYGSVKKFKERFNALCDELEEPSLQEFAKRERFPHTETTQLTHT